MRSTAVLGRALITCLVVGCAPPRPQMPPPRPRVADGASGPKLPERPRSQSAAGEVERIYTLKPVPGAPVLGGDDAKVRVEVCSDFECPYCARHALVMHELHENYGDLVRIVFRNCPLPVHPHALDAAEAAREVHAQAGDAAFWAYHDRLFAHQHALSEARIVELARGIAGVDLERLRAALRDGRHEAAIRAELLGLVASGAAPEGIATPATFVNGRLFAGALPYRVFEDAVERALAEPPSERDAAVAASEAAYPMARTRHILVQYAGAVGADARVARSKEEARARAIEIRQRLAVEGDFERVAREESDCPSASRGGELGRFTRGELEERFEQALFSLAPGELSEVVETPFGFHIILREE